MNFDKKFRIKLYDSSNGVELNINVFGASRYAKVIDFIRKREENSPLTSGNDDIFVVSEAELRALKLFIKESAG